MKTLAIQKRMELEEHLMKNPRFAPFVEKMKEERAKTAKHVSEADYYKSLVDEIRRSWIVGGELKYSDADLFRLDIETIGVLAKGLASLVTTLEEKDKKSYDDASKAFYDSIELLKTIAGKSFEINIPEIKLPEINGPSPQIIHETKHAELASKILEGVFLQMKQLLEGVTIRNSEPGDAIPVRMVDRQGKKFVDLLSSIIATGGSSGATTIPGDLGSGYVSDHDNNFVTGDSPVEYDFVSLMGRKAKVISMLNFGSGDLTLAVNEGDEYGDEIIVPIGQSFTWSFGLATKARVTWVANTKYSITAK